MIRDPLPWSICLWITANSVRVMEIFHPSVFFEFMQKSHRPTEIKNIDFWKPGCFRNYRRTQ